MKKLLRTAVVAVALLGACSTPNADQCTPGASGDGDCERILGVASGQASCDLGTCKSKGNQTAVPPAEAGAPGSACVSTEKCTADNGGQPSLCREPGITPCQAITNEQCNVFGDGWKQTADPIFVGVFHSRTDKTDGSTLPYDVTNEKVVRLAEEEWLAATTGGLSVAGKRRAIVGIYCDIQNDPDLARKAFDFVTLGVGAPAVITRLPQNLGWFLDAADSRKTFVYLEDFGCDDIAPTGKLGGLCHTNAAPFDYQKALMKEWVKANERAIRAERGLGTSDELKAVLLAQRAGNSASFGTYMDELDKELELNGASVTTQPTLYKEINPQVLEDGTIDYFGTAKAVSAFAPDIVVTLEARDFHLWYLPMVEATWPAAVPRPHYVGTDNIAFARRFAVSVGGNDELRRRVSGVWTGTEPETAPVYDDLLKRYAARYGEENLDEVVTGLDAWYATAYGIAAALTSQTVDKTKPLTGADIGAAMKRLTSGAAAPLLPSSIASSIGTLTAGASVDLVGAISTLDWEPANGCPRSDAAVFCVFRDDGQQLHVDDLGPYWHHKTDAFEPATPFTQTCP